MATVAATDESQSVIVTTAAKVQTNTKQSKKRKTTASGAAAKRRKTKEADDETAPQELDDTAAIVTAPGGPTRVKRKRKSDPITNQSAVAAVTRLATTLCVCQPWNTCDACIAKEMKRGINKTPQLPTHKRKGVSSASNAPTTEELPPPPLNETHESEVAKNPTAPALLATTNVKKIQDSRARYSALSRVNKPRVGESTQQQQQQQTLVQKLRTNLSTETVLQAECQPVRHGLTRVTAGSLLTPSDPFAYLMSCTFGPISPLVGHLSKLVDSVVREQYEQAFQRPRPQTQNDTYGNLSGGFVSSFLQYTIGVPSDTLNVQTPCDLADVIRAQDFQNAAAKTLREAPRDVRCTEQAIRAQFAQAFLYDNPTNTPLGMSTDLTRAWSSSDQETVPGDNNNNAEGTDSSSQTTSARCAPHTYHIDPAVFLSGQPKHRADPVFASEVLRAMHRENAETRSGYEFRHAKRSTNLSELPDVPELSITYLQAWFCEQPNTQECAYPMCINGSQCVCLGLADRTGTVLVDERLPHGTVNGAVPLATERQVPPSIHATRGVIDRSNYTDRSTQGFLCHQYMSPWEHEHFLKTGEVPAPGPCALCHIAEVSREHHDSANVMTQETGPILNKFSVLIGPHEFSADCCLPMLNGSGLTRIRGYFPAFRQDCWYLSTYKAAGDDRKYQCVRMRGMDFWLSSAK